MSEPVTVDEYIEGFPEEVQSLLGEVRRTIADALPDARERLSYGIPAFTIDDKSVVFYAGWKNHMSVYPIPAVGDDLEREIATYRAGKGTLKFPLGDPVPFDLIRRVVILLAEQR